MKKSRTWITLAVLAIAAFAFGYMLRGCGSSSGPSPASQDQAVAEAEASEWTCSMHPQIRQPAPGLCPICAMDLIPVTGGGDDGLSPRELRLSPSAQKLAGIVTMAAERRFIPAEVRLSGKVDYDETRMGHIAARVSGRLDRLYVDFTGMRVSKGDHLADIYSPDLIAAQEELIQALRAAEELKASGLHSIRETALETVDAVREKLRLWGLKPAQIEQIETQGRPTDHLTLYAPMGGIVIRKTAVEGMYVKTGEEICTIADLSSLWVKLDAYESDLPMIKYGQQVELRSEAYPGEHFKGKISFIDPSLDARTRTVKVRVNVDNKDGRLKPEMFIQARVEAGVTDSGTIVGTNLAGKWICPMHPEIIKSRQEPCDICGMDLVTARSLGYTDDDPSRRKPPLIIPASAPLITGRRAVVYVASREKKGVFEGREVVLGPRAGDWYVVREGLVEGELVVVEGNFKIDSAIQILAGPSMMNPEGGGSAPGHDHGGHKAAGEMAAGPFKVPAKFKEQLDGVYAAYFDVSTAYSLDDVDKARQGAITIVAALKEVDMTLLGSDAHLAWMKLSQKIEKAAGVISAAGIKKGRVSFEPLSDAVTAAVRSFGASGRQQVIRFHCPMAFDWKGADWLQNRTGVENPYFGSEMYRCGTEEETIVTADH
jgi:Cu(I)/Ag(I) efflux system membrane fusion protein